MKKIKVGLGKRSYDIIVARNALCSIGKEVKKLDLGNCAYIITHSFLKNRYGKILAKSLSKRGIKDIKFKILPENERTKSISYALKVVNDIVKTGKNKRIFLIAFGGGVIGDLSGFVASVYKRGIAYIQVPTTLLAQVDASIGGKTAIDLPLAKNIVGAFYQPRLVISDIALLNTLSARQMLAGLAEIIKYAAIKDKTLFKYLEENKEGILNKETPVLEYIIYRSSHIKAKIVSQDEKETKGLRTILNFGHTFGHAIETACGYRKYNHGEAVAIGMLCAIDLSMHLKLLDKQNHSRIEKLIQSYGLPVKIEAVSLNKIIKSLYYDKKFLGPRNRFVLLKRIGTTVIKENIPDYLIKDIVRKRMHS